MKLTLARALAQLVDLHDDDQEVKEPNREPRTVTLHLKEAK